MDSDDVQSALEQAVLDHGPPGAVIIGADISPDGRYISFIKPLKGTMNVWVKGVDEPFSAARPMTSDQARPVRSYFWSRDGKFLLLTGRHFVTKTNAPFTDFNSSTKPNEYGYILYDLEKQNFP